MALTKTCPKCALELTVDNFHRNKSEYDGLQTWCKACSRSFRVNKRFANPEWYAEVLRVARESRRGIDPETKRIQLLNWQRANKDKVSQYNRKRKALVRGGAGNLTHEEWLTILDYYQHRCAYCFVDTAKLTQDHMLPVSRGGAHSKENVVPACTACNSGKKDKTPLEFMLIRGGNC